jgi:hypothetical protein
LSSSLFEWSKSKAENNFASKSYIEHSGRENQVSDRAFINSSLSSIELKANRCALGESGANPP